MSTQSFAELGVSKDVVRALRAGGVTKPFPVQAQVVPDVLEGRDVLVKSPTGSGKTLAFAVPLVELIERADPKAAALVLAPTRELALQIVEETKPLARARGLNVAAVYGGTGFGAQVAAVRKAHIVVATPGRLEDLIARGDIRLDRVGIVVLDEADRMLDMGFRPPVDRILGKTPNDRQTLFFSATLDGEVGRLANQYTRNAGAPRAQAGRRAEPGTPTTASSAVRHEDKLDTLIEHLGDGRPRPDARVRPHQARRRPAGEAAEGARGRRRRHARRQDAGAARARAPELPLRRTATRWWPRTWPRAGSTSTTSPT